MHSTQADFTQTFRTLRPIDPGLSGSTAPNLNTDQENMTHSESTAPDPKFFDWHQRWNERLQRQSLPYPGY